MHALSPSPSPARGDRRKSLWERGWPTGRERANGVAIKGNINTLGGLFGGLTAGINQRYLTMEIEGLRKRCESGDAGEAGA